MALIQLEDVAAHGPAGEGDTVADATRDDADFVGPHEEAAELGLDVEDAVLQDDEEVAVCRVKGLVGIHVLSGGEDEDANARLERRVACARDEAERVDPVDRLVEVKGVPAQLVGYLVDLLVRLVFRVCVVG